MIKKIKQYLQLQTRIQFEIIETLASICKCLSYDGRHSRNPYSGCLESHYHALLELGKDIRKR